MQSMAMRSRSLWPSGVMRRPLQRNVSRNNGGHATTLPVGILLHKFQFFERLKSFTSNWAGRFGMMRRAESAVLWVSMDGFESANTNTGSEVNMSGHRSYKEWKSWTNASINFWVTYQHEGRTSQGLREQVLGKQRFWRTRSKRARRGFLDASSEQRKL